MRQTAGHCIQTLDNKPARAELRLRFTSRYWRRASNVLNTLVNAISMEACKPSLQGSASRMGSHIPENWH